MNKSNKQGFLKISYNYQISDNDEWYGTISHIFSLEQDLVTRLNLASLQIRRNIHIHIYVYKYHK